MSALLSVVVLLVCGIGYAAVHFYEGRVTRTVLDNGRVEGTRPPAIAHGRETWLLVGSDVRTGSDAAKVGGARSDTMMIAYLGSDGSTTMVSVPRDLRVTIPAYTDDNGRRHSAHTDKVNAAFSAGGPSLLVRTLENVADIRIDHFAEIDFGGFKQMSAALGGVEVCMVADPYVERFQNDRGRTVVATNLNDPNSGFRGQAGTNVLSGDQALAFVRQRHGFADGDLSRIRRQQAFLGAVFRKVNSGGLLTDPGKLSSFLGAVTDSTVLDEGTGLSDLRVLAERMRGMNTGQVQFTTIPISGQIAQPVFYFTYSATAVRAFFQQIVAEVGQAGDGAPGAPTPSISAAPGASAAGAGPSPRATVAPASIRVTVLNGTLTRGLASTAAAQLRSAGYQVVRVGNATDRRQDRTEVRYSLDSSPDTAAAGTVLAAVPGARAVPDSAVPAGGITLVVGSDLAAGDTVVAATPTARSSATARTSATPTPQAYYTQAPVSAAGGCVK
jgi:LCP family protein required for cell wall assembly